MSICFMSYAICVDWLIFTVNCVNFSCQIRFKFNLNSPMISDIYMELTECYCSLIELISVTSWIHWFVNSLCGETEFKNLRSLEICGGALTDAGVKNIKELSSLVCLNLSQNSNLTDKTLELISGTFAFLCFIWLWSLILFAFFSFLTKLKT